MVVVCHKMGRPSPAGCGRKRVETGGFSASAIASPVEPLTSVHRCQSILRGAGRHEHPPLDIDINLLGANSHSNNYTLEDMDKDDSDDKDESSEWKERKV